MKEVSKLRLEVMSFFLPLIKITNIFTNIFEIMVKIAFNYTK